MSETHAPQTMQPASDNLVTVAQVKPVPAVMRASALLDYIAAVKMPVSISDLARALGFPKSSVHGLCHTLCGLNLLHMRDDGKFALGAHMLQWANAYLAQTNLVDEFHRLLAEDKNLNDYTITLSVLEGTEVLYMACRNSHAPLGVTFNIGMKLPAVFAATGKAMLAALTEESLENYLQAPWPVRLTRHSVADSEALRKELLETRLRGYSVDDGQVREGMVCLGATIYNVRGGIEAGIALSMTKTEAQPEVVEKVAQGVMEIARHLSLRLGTGLR